MTEATDNEEMGRFGFDGAEGIAFWVYSDASQEEAQSTVMLADMPVLVEFLRHNFPGYFEQARTPTDDEPWLNNLSYAATALEASADNGDRYCARLIREHLSALRRPVQGEPTDAHVRAVWDALGPGITVAFEYEQLRAALRAAAATLSAASSGERTETSNEEL